MTSPNDSRRGEVPYTPNDVPAKAPLPRHSLSRCFLFAVAASFILSASSFAVSDTLVKVNTSATDLSSSNSYSSTTIVPTAASGTDVEFQNTTYISNYFTTNGAALVFGSINDLDASQSLIITNSNSTASTITLSDAIGNGVSGNTADLLYVAAGGNLTFQNSTSGTESIVFSKSGDIDNSGSLSVATSLSIAGGGTLTFIGAGNTSISGNFANTTGAVTINNPDGAVSFSGANAYTGLTTLTAGALTLDFSQATSPQNNIIASGNALNLGGGTLNIIGAGSAMITSQTFGAVTVASGQSELSITQNAATAVNVTMGAITRNAGGAIDFTLPASGVNLTTASATFSAGNNNILVSAATNSVAFATANGGATWASNAAGTISALAQSAYSATGTGGTYSAGNDMDVTNGDTEAGFTVNTLRFNSAGDTLTLSGSNIVSTGGILITPTGAGSVITGGVIAPGGGNEIAIADFSSATIASAIGNGTAAAALTVGGTGATTLSGASTYTGPTYVNGIVNAGGPTVLSGTQVISSPLGANSAVTIGNSAYSALNLNGNDLTIGSLASASAGTVNLGGNTLTVGNLGTTTSYFGAINGTGALAKVGAGTLNIQSATAMSGTVNLLNGTLAAGNNNAFGTAIISLGDPAGGSNSVTLKDEALSPLSAIIDNTIRVLAGTSGTIAFEEGNNDTSNSTIILGYNGGSQNLSFGNAGQGTSSYDGALSGTGNFILNNAVINAGGALQENVSGGTVNNVGLVENLSLGTNSTISFAAALGANVLGLVQNSPAIGMSINNSETSFTGDTTVTSGTLQIGNNSALANSVLNVSSSGVLVFAVTGPDIGGLAGASSLSVADGASNMALTLGDSNVSNSNSSNTLNPTFSGSILQTTGTVSLTKIGTDTQTLSGSSNYTGATAINSGELALTGAGTLGASGSSALIMGGGLLDLGGGNDTFASLSITTAPASGNTIQNGSLSAASYAASNTTGTAIVTANLLADGNAGLAKSGAGTLTLAGNDSYIGPTSVTAGTLSLTGTIGSGAGTAISNAANITESSAGVITGTSALTNTAGTAALNGANSYTGNTTVSGGQLDINSSTAIGTGTLSLANGITIDNTSGADVTLSTNNPQIWAGNLTYAGSVPDSLNMGTGTITLNASPTVTVTSGTLTEGGNFFNTGPNDSLTKNGNGTLVLSGSLNTGSGNLNVTGGTLTVSGTVIDNSGGMGDNGAEGAVAPTFNFVGDSIFTMNGDWNYLSNSGALGNSNKLNLNIGGDSQLIDNGGRFFFGKASNVTAVITQTGGLLFENNTALLLNAAGSAAVNSYVTYYLDGGILKSKAGMTMDTNSLLYFNGGTFATNTTTTANSTNTEYGQAGGVAGQILVDAGGGSIDAFPSTSLYWVIPINHDTANLGATVDGGITKLDTGTLDLVSFNTYTGPTTVNGGTLNDDFTSVATASNTGQSNHISSASQLVLGGGGFTVTGMGVGAAQSSLTVTATTYAGSDLYTLTFGAAPSGIDAGQAVTGDGLTNAYIVNQIPNSKTIEVYSTTALTGTGSANPVAIVAGSSLASSQTVAGLTVNSGASTIVLNANGGGGTFLALNGITRNVGGTIDFTNPSGTINNTTNGITTTNSNNAAGIIGAWATVSGANYASINGNGNIVAYTGYTDINATGSTLASNATSNVEINAGGSGGDITLGSSPTTTINTLLQGATTSGTVALGGNTLQLAGVLLPSGEQALTIGASSGDGFLQASSAGGELTLINNSTSNALTVNSTVADNSTASVLTKSGAGTLALDGANTYTGATYINAGTLTYTVAANGGSAGGLGQSSNAASNVMMGNGATLQYTGTGGSSDRLFTVNDSSFDGSGSGPIDYTNTGSLAYGTTNVLLTVTLTGANTGANTFYPLISNNSNDTTVSLTKTGAGMWVIPSTETYTGATTISAGTLTLTGTLGSGSGIANQGGGTAITNSATFNESATGVITGIGSFNNGSGTSTLAGFNTYTGITNITGGTLIFTNAANGGSPSSLGQSSSAASNLLLSNGGGPVLEYTGAGGSTDRLFTLSDNGVGQTMSINASGSGPIDFTNTGSILFGTGSDTVIFVLTGTNTGMNTMTPVLGNNFTAGVSLSKTGAGTWVIPSAETYTGVTTISAGTLYLTGTLGSGYGTAISNAATFNETTGVVSGTSTFTNTAGFATLDGANTYSGGSSITGGILEFGNLTSMPATGTVAVNGGDLAVDIAGTGEWTTGTSAAAGSIGGLLAGIGGQGNTVTWAGNSTIGIDTTFATGAQTYSGVIGNVGTSLGLNKLGPGTLILTASETYTGATTVTSGTLQLGNGTVGQDGQLNGNVTDNSMLAIDLAATSSTFGGTISGSGGFTFTGNGANTLYLSAGNSYTGGSTINSGTLTLLANAGLGGNYYPLTVNNGTLNVNGKLPYFSNVSLNNGVLGIGNSGNVVYSGTITSTGASSIAPGQFSYNGAVPATFAVSSGTLTTNLDGAWVDGGSFGGGGSNPLGLIKSGPGTMVVVVQDSTGSVFNGPVAIDGGIYSIGNLLVVSSTGTVQTTGNPLGASSNANTNLILNGGTLQYTGGTATSSTTDRLFSLGANGGALDASGSVALSFTNTGAIGYNSQTGARTLTVTGSNLGANTLDAAIGDEGGGSPTSLVKSGVGQWVLGGVNTYSGGTTISSGTLEMGGAGALGATTGSLTVNGGALDLNGNNLTVGTLAGAGGLITNSSAATMTLTVNSAGGSTYAGAIANTSGTVGLNVSGTGALTLSGNNTYNGPTNVIGGTLIVSGSLSGTGAVNLDPSTLEVDGLVNTSAAISATNSTVQGTGMAGAITLTSTSALAPGQTVNAGGFVPNSALTAAGNVAFSDTASTLNLGIALTASGTDATQLAITTGSVALDNTPLLLTLGTGINQPSLAANNQVYIIINGGATLASGIGQGTDQFGSINGVALSGDQVNLNGFVFNVLYGYNPGDGMEDAGGTDVALQLIAVPEPGTWAMLLAGAGMLAAFQRKRRHGRRP
jgi:autotransporter-associated beta strand protein